MIEKVDFKTTVDVLSVIGWGALLIIALRSAMRILVGYTKPKSQEDKQLAASLQGDILKAIAEQWKESNNQLSRMETRLGVLESRQQWIEAEIRKRG